RVGKPAEGEHDGVGRVHLPVDLHRLDLAVATRFEPGDARHAGYDLRARYGDVVRHLIRFRTIAHDDDASARQHTVDVEEKLRRPRGHDPGQRPTREGQHTVG